MTNHLNYHHFRPFLAVAMAGISLLAGCGYLRQSRDDFAMDTVPVMRLAQTLNPEAGKNHKAVTGLDAVAAQNVNASYEKSFVKAESTQKSAAQAFLGLAGLSND
jgi:hypothetical protein